MDRELRWAAVGAAVMGAVLTASVVVYVVPFDESTYWAEMPEVGSVKVGDDVRIAGVPVGAVKSIELSRRNVRMSFTVDSDIFIGDQTSLDIRMLTLIGGRYLAVTPAGNSALHSSIPAERVHLPYSLGRTFEDAIRPIDDIDGDTLRQNLTNMNAAIASGPSGIRRATEAFGSLVDILDRQNRDISDTLAMADEYLGAINESKATLGGMIDSVNLMETVGLDKKAEIYEAVRLMDELLARIAGLEPAYRSSCNPLREPWPTSSLSWNVWVKKWDRLSRIRATYWRGSSRSRRRRMGSWSTNPRQLSRYRRCVFRSPERSADDE